MLFCYLFLKQSLYIALAVLELCRPGLPLLPSARIKDMCHYTVLGDEYIFGG